MPYKKTLAQELESFLTLRHSDEYDDEYWEDREYLINKIKDLEKQNIDAQRDLARAKNILNEANQIKEKYGVIHERTN